MTRRNGGVVRGNRFHLLGYGLALVLTLVAWRRYGPGLTRLAAHPSRGRREAVGRPPPASTHPRHAPPEARAAGRRKGSAGGEIATYVAGYALALVLTGLAFAAVVWHLYDTRTTVIVVLVLGLVQMIVHFRFFLHVDFGRSARDDLQLILFSTLIIAIMVGGTLVVLMNLRERMM